MMLTSIQVPILTWLLTTFNLVQAVPQLPLPIPDDRFPGRLPGELPTETPDDEPEETPVPVDPFDPSTWGNLEIIKGVTGKIEQGTYKTLRYGALFILLIVAILIIAGSSKTVQAVAKTAVTKGAM
jgi:hypothetical protein